MEKIILNNNLTPEECEILGIPVMGACELTTDYDLLTQEEIQKQVQEVRDILTKEKGVDWSKIPSTFKPITKEEFQMIDEFVARCRKQISDD